MRISKYLKYLRETYNGSREDNLNNKIINTRGVYGAPTCLGISEDPKIIREIDNASREDNLNKTNKKNKIIKSPGLQSTEVPRGLME